VLRRGLAELTERGIMRPRSGLRRRGDAPGAVAVGRRPFGLAGLAGLVVAGRDPIEVGVERRLAAGVAAVTRPSTSRIAGVGWSA
jgi:hypothetical protein